MNVIKRIFAMGVVVWLTGGTVFAQDFVARLVYAFNSPTPARVDTQIDDRTRERLKKVFGYQYYRVAQEASSPLARIKSDFPPLGKDFSLSIEQLERDKDRFKLRVGFFHKDKSLVSSTFDFQENTPLFIKGPNYDQGTLILIIVMK